MRHALEILLSVLHYRLGGRLMQRLEIARLDSAVLLEQGKCLVQQCPVYACFIDFEKAFGNVKHVELVRVLEWVSISTT